MEKSAARKRNGNKGGKPALLGRYIPHYLINRFCTIGVLFSLCFPVIDYIPCNVYSLLVSFPTIGFSIRTAHGNSFFHITMATPPSPSPDSLPPKEQEDKREPDPNRGKGIPEYYNDLISTLPSHKGWEPTLLLKYQDFWFPEYILPGIINLQQHFKARPSDLFLMSYPKSGTTWLKALAFATINRNRFQLANHPLLSHNPHDCIPVIDVDFASKIEGMPSPRILHSHCPFSLLPDSIKGSDCRIIYVCRDAKDVMVSDWFFTNRLRRSNEVELVQFGKAFELFCEGICYYGPIWDHVLEYWEESLRRPERVLFLKYEEMLADPAGNVKKLAEFFFFFDENELENI